MCCDLVCVSYVCIRTCVCVCVLSDACMSESLVDPSCVHVFAHACSSLSLSNSCVDLPAAYDMARTPFVAMSIYTFKVLHVGVYNYHCNYTCRYISSCKCALQVASSELS